MKTKLPSKSASKANEAPAAQVVEKPVVNRAPPLRRKRRPPVGIPRDETHQVEAVEETVA
jgi:hypothetical protein